jgi:hypothetical protein
MKVFSILCATLLGIAGLHPPGAAETVSVVSPDGAGGTGKLAASELVRYLGRLYPQTKFVTAASLPASGNAILVGSDAAVRALVSDADLSKPESHAVRNMRRGSLRLGVIAGADARGTMFGIYALLEKLGCGFYLSGDAVPAARAEPFSFAGWELGNAPLVSDRIVFNWHNFLSGCSTWNLADWNHWTEQSQKMGYNAIMVHAYGNNPMVSFAFNGKTKPVGYLSTTVKGRDWSTMHVNDARRLWGGGVFHSPVFGADAAQVPDAARAAAARKLMRGVFAHAQRRGMGVFFANDVDTISANPQELIRTLPEGARFAIQTEALGWMGQEAGKFWLANPDTADGCRYYRAQAAALLAAYPQITTLVLWFRREGTPWMGMKPAEMPPTWQKQYAMELARAPDAAKLWKSAQLFALGKVARAWQRALKELGHSRVGLAAGTWDFKFLPACHRFFPPGVKLIGLDYSVLHERPQLGDAELRAELRAVAAHRPVVPVIWAHHDDGHYLGRPYTPFADFHGKLADAKASGFGIIHWTTRPLDLYFKSHAEQVWSATKDRPLRATCDDMAARLAGAGARAAMAAYLERWVTEAPRFGRETTDHFIDRPLTNITQVVAGCRERLKLIEPVKGDAAGYFRGLEGFIVAFYQTHERFQNAEDAFKKGNLAAARAALAECRPEPVIEQFAKFSSIGGMTRGEQGLVVSLNTRWLPHIVRLRQQLGMEAVRYNFGLTSHDPLAQSPGRFTFHFDEEHRIWQTLGATETGARVFSSSAAKDELCRAGIASGKPLTLTLGPIMARPARGKETPALLPAGDYRVRLLLGGAPPAVADRCFFDVSIANGPAERVDIVGRAIERAYPVTLQSPGAVSVTLTPVKGCAAICAAVVEPLAPPTRRCTVFSCGMGLRDEVEGEGRFVSAVLEEGGPTPMGCGLRP